MKKPSGLTLIELIAALAIVSLLMAVALRVATQLARRQDALQRPGGGSGLRERLGAVLEADFVHARRYRSGPSGLAVMTQASLDGRTMAMEHLPTEVTYLVRKIGSISWLLRRQKLPRGGSFTEAVCSGVRDIRIASADGARAPSPDQWKMLPAAVNVTVGFQDTRRRPIRLCFHTKWQR